ncbi:MAG: NADH-quinone oxidoreductase subunit H [Bacteroidetes bacterium]|nr:NADH-quinone oxidoreductase subunit H [Bacteroidota bacterium]
MIVLILAIFTALFFPGIIVRVKSILSGRKGPGLMQPWKNILLLFRKGSVISKTTSFIFRIAPVIYLSTILVSLLLLPFPGLPSLFDFTADFILLAYLLALGKFFFIIGAMDTGSSFEGMGANREALYSLLAEPAFFILFGTLALLTGHLSMHSIFNYFQMSGYDSVIIGIIAVYILIQIGMIENSRMPVDDPKTHLELTMIHEVMVLDHSGFDLALIQTGTALKFALYGTLIANILIPVSWEIPGRIAVYLLIQVIFATIIGILESFRARKKLMKNPQFIATLSSIALVAFIISLLMISKLIQ